MSYMQGGLQVTLNNLWDGGNLPQTSMIKSDNYEESVLEVMEFINKVTKDYTSISPENNTDICKIQLNENKKGDLQKYISVEQIRGLQVHFSSTSGLSPYKFAIVIGAELMNLNASNCLLKILEDTPEYGYIFLITQQYDKLIPTIKSRCINIYEGFSEDTRKNHDLKPSIYRILNPEVRFEDKIIDINALASEKNISVAESTQLIISTIGEISMLKTDIFDEDYQAIYEYLQKQKVTIDHLYNYYIEARKLLLATEESFLDLRQIIMILISKFLLLK